MYVLAKLETSTRNYKDIYISKDSKLFTDEPNTDIKVLTQDVSLSEAKKQLVYWRMYLLGSA